MLRMSLPAQLPSSSRSRRQASEGKTGHEMGVILEIV
jgi:hypothetical protein